MQVTNEQAHEIHSQFKYLCDMFNSPIIDPNDYSSNFDGLPDHMLKIYQDTAIKCWTMFKWLREKEHCEATQAYCIACGKILIRLSCLRDNGQRETPEQFNKWIRLYT